MMTTESARRTDSAKAGEERQMHAGRKPFLTFAAAVRGRDVSVANALVGGVAAENVTLRRAIARTAFVGRNVSVQQGGAALIAAAGRVSIEQGGAQAVMANGDVNLEQSGTGIAVARSVRAASGGTIAVAMSPRVQVEDGGRVIVGPPLSLVIAGALAVGAYALAVAVRRHR